MDWKSSGTKVKTFVWSLLRLVICGIQAIGLGVFTPILRVHSVSLLRTLEGPDCFDSLTIDVTAYPSDIMSGQSSILYWSVHLLPGCVATSVKLNGRSVPPSGREIVTPSQSTTYRVTVVLDLNGIPTEKTASTHLMVSDSSIYLFCPYLFQSNAIELWKPELQTDKKPDDQMTRGLEELLSDPDTTILTGPGVAPDFHGANHNESSYTFGPNATITNICTLMPFIPGPRLNDLIPDGNDPGATAATA